MADQVFVVVFRNTDESELRAIERQLQGLDASPDVVLACTPQQVRVVLDAVDL